MNEHLGAFSGSRPTGQAPAGLDASRIDPARGALSIEPGQVWRSQGYAMTTIDSGRDADGAPLSEIWAFANEDDSALGDGWLDVIVHEVVETERSGALAVYYKQWFAPDGTPAWGKSWKRKVGALGSLKSMIRRRRMEAIAIEAQRAETQGGSVHESAGRKASPNPIHHTTPDQE